MKIRKQLCVAVICAMVVALTGCSDESEIPENCEYEKEVECVVTNKKDNTVKSTGSLELENETAMAQTGFVMTRRSSSRSSSHRSSSRSSSKRSSSSSSKKSSSNSAKKSSSSHSGSSHFFSRNRYYSRPSHYYYYSRGRRNRNRNDYNYNEDYEVTVTYQEQNITYTFFNKGMFDSYDIGDTITMKFYKNTEDITKSVLVPIEE